MGTCCRGDLLASRLGGSSDTRHPQPALVPVRDVPRVRRRPGRHGGGVLPRHDAYRSPPPPLPEVE
mgnify:CR=1 FL=1